MTATYNPNLIDRLVREAREDDATIKWADQHFRESTPWPECGHDEATCPCFDNNDRVRGALAKATLRVRDSLVAMADQLEAARREVERLRGIEERFSSFAGHLERVGPCRLCGDLAVEVRDRLAGGDSTIDAYRAAKGKT